MRSNRWNCCPHIFLFESSKTWKIQIVEQCCHCCCCRLFFGTKVERTHCDSKHWALLLFHYIKKLCYARYFNIPIMFKCFQNLSARHKNTLYAHIHIPKLAKDSALIIIYLLSFQRKWARSLGFLLHLHWSWARYMAHILGPYRNLPEIDQKYLNSFSVITLKAKWNVTNDEMWTNIRTKKKRFFSISL